MTTFNSNGTVANVTGTQTWDRTATGTSTWDYNAQQEHWRNYWDDTYPLLTVTTVDQDASETHALNGSWSKNLSTNVTTTIVNTASTTGSHEFHLTHDEYVGDPEVDGYLDYQNPYDHESTFSYTFAGWWPGISGEHGFTPLDLGTLEHSGAVPGNTGWDIGPQVNPTNNIPYEGPDGVAFPPQTPPPTTNPPAVHQPPVEVPQNHNRPMRAGDKGLGFEIAGMPEAARQWSTNVQGVHDETLPGVAATLPGVGGFFDAHTMITGNNLWDQRVSATDRAWATFGVAMNGIGMMGGLAGAGLMDEFADSSQVVRKAGNLGNHADEAAGTAKVGKQGARNSKQIRQQIKRGAKEGQCFVAGTPVHVQEGLKPIEEVRPGDVVWAYDLVRSCWSLKVVQRRFHRTMNDLFALVQINGEVIESTYRHPYWVIEGEGLAERPSEQHLAPVAKNATTPGRWVDAGDLKAGDVVLLHDAKPVRVESVTHQRKEQTVYNFAVDDLKCYAVGTCGALVHNENGAEIPWTSPEVRAAAKKLQEGATEVIVRTRSQAEELFLRLYQAEGYRNTDGWSVSLLKRFGSAGTYHWDEVFGQASKVMPGLKVLVRYYDDGALHNYVRHLQIQVVVASCVAGLSGIRPSCCGDTEPPA